MITCIFACNEDGVIGKDGKLPWRVKSDLNHFMKSTSDKVVIMGRKTFEETGILPFRTNVVVTSHPVEGVYTFKTLDEAIEKFKDQDIFLIGGKRILEEGFLKCDRVLMSLIPIEVPGETVKVNLAFTNYFKAVSCREMEIPGEPKYQIIEYRKF